MEAFGPIVYFLCFITSTLAMLLLFRSYLRTRSRLLFWSALGFVALIFASINIFGGFIVSQRMLRMYRKKK